MSQPPTMLPVFHEPPSSLPGLLPLAAKVARVHGDHDPRLRDVHATLADVIDELESDAGAVRREVEAGLGKIRLLCDGYNPPEWACNSYRALLSRLRSLEDEVLQK